ncbi:hypothetical protein A5655_12455 [Mycobacterium sp. 1081908.1]|nr:hypothetical protein A5655_12455 [Mycobacterium sp. 1081908.1]
MSEGVNPPPPPRTWAQMPANASNHNRLSRLTCAWSSVEGAQVQRACSCGPVSASTVLALSSTVCISGMGMAAATSVTDQPPWLRRQTSPDTSAVAPRRPR